MVNKYELAYLETMTDEEAYIYLMEQGDQIANMQWEGREVGKMLADLKATEKAFWKKRKNNVCSDA